MNRSSMTVDNLCYTYPGRTAPALKNICLDVPRGSVVLITGPTGCGKSTLLKCVCGIVPHETGGVMTGRIRIGSLHDTRRASLSEIARQVGLVFQNPDEQIFATTVRDEIGFGPENRGIPEDSVERIVAEALTCVGLPDAVHKRIVELSGGQKQRVVIAGQLAVGHEILCLDEPFSQMDPRSASSLREVLRHLASTRRRTIILVEHRVHEVADLVNRVVIMENGAISMDRDAPAAFDDLSTFRRLGLNVPQSADLFERLGFRERPLDAARALALLRERAGPATINPRASDPIAGIRMGNVYIGISASPPCSPSSGLEQIPAYPSGPARGSRSTPLGTCHQERRPDFAIEIDELAFHYDPARPLFEDLRLSISAGERLAVMGPNGCGKTTLLLLIAGLLKPLRGVIRYDGETVKRERVLGRRAGLLLQNPDLMLIRDTVDEELLFPLHNNGTYGKEAERKAREALEVMMIAPLQNDYCFALSRGQRLRTAVASLLTLAPPVMLLDEPTTGQDRNNISEMMAHFEHTPTTVVFSTHDLSTAICHATRLLVLKDGRIRYDGRPTGFFRPSEFDPECALVPADVMRIAQGLGIEEPVATVDDLVAAWSGA